MAASLSPAIRNFLVNGRSGTPSGAASVGISSPRSSSSSSSAASLQSDAELIAALQKALQQSQSSGPGALDVQREQLVPLLQLPAPGGLAALVTLWKGAFHVKAAEPSGFSTDPSVQTHVQIAVLSVRLLRNVVAGHPGLQVLLFEGLASQVLELLRLGSSLAFSNDIELAPLVRSLIQLLSNMITTNKPLQKSLFQKLRLVKDLPHSEYDSAVDRITVLQNLLASPDAGTVEAVQILLLNCIKSSPTNSSALAISPGGRKVLGQLLHLFEASSSEEGDHNGVQGSSIGPGSNGSDSASSEDEGEDDMADFEFGADDLEIEDGGPTIPTPKPKASEKEKRDVARSQAPAPSKPKSSAEDLASIAVGYAIFAHLLEIGLFRHMYICLAHRHSLSPHAADEDMIISTEQTLLLKTLDAWINAGGQHHEMHEFSSMDQFRILPNEMVRLSQFVRGVLGQWKEKKGDSSFVPDRQLLAAHEALVLVIEALIQIGMIGCEGMEKDEQFQGECEQVLKRMRTSPPDFVEATEEANGSGGSLDVDVVKEAIDLLKATSESLPVISPFKSNLGAGSKGNPVHLPQGHIPSSTGLAGVTGSEADGEAPRLDNLNRVLIQLLGVLVFQHSATSMPESFKERSFAETDEEMRLVRAVQDRVREVGGLLTVLGMTKLDDSNPYIREHAIFTLRYLLQGNHENQAVIEQLEPVAAT